MKTLGEFRSWLKGFRVESSQLIVKDVDSGQFFSVKDIKEYFDPNSKSYTTCIEIEAFNVQ